MHELAQSIGLRRIGFQGDHYDVDETDRDRALAAGAAATASRELVRRLRAAGLRRRSGSEPCWQRLASSPAGADTHEVLVALEKLGASGERLTAGVDRLGPLAMAGSLGLYGRPDRLAVVVDLSTPIPPAADRWTLEAVDEVWLSGPRADGQRSLELFVVR